LPRGNERIALFAHKLSDKLRAMGKWPEALIWHNRVVDHLESSLLEETHPGQRQKIANALAICYFARGLLLQQLDKPGEAVVEFDRAMQVKDARLPLAIALQCATARVFAAADAAKKAKNPAP
jgi:hypothetical protein